MAGMKQRIIDLYDWFEHRLGLGKFVTDEAEHPVPSNTSSWWYVFGSAATVVLVMQVVTGILLAMVYAPTAGEAWNSLHFIDHNVTLGWFLRAMHGWGSDFMVAIVIIHLLQVFTFGAYKYPRELTWIVGVFLLLLTLGMAFTGQVLRFDQDAYWGLGIGASIVSRVPWVGGALVDILLGGPILASSTLSRFFALHVFVIPGTLLALVGVHLWMVLRLGINDWPMPGRVVSKKTYSAEYHQLIEKTGIPFVPDAAWKDALFAAAILLAVMACALWFGPFGPSGAPDPTIIDTSPKPDVAFLWIYAVLAYLPPELETPVILIAPVVIIGAMLLLPLVFSEGEKHWTRRPMALLMVAVTAVALGVFTRLGTYTPWSPIMDAWTTDAVPVNDLKERTPLERAGAIVFQNKQCRNCHSIGGEGGMRGPALDTIASQMTQDQMIRQVLQGGGNMPAYGNALSPAETTALVHFLITLRSGNLPSAIDASRSMANSGKTPTQAEPRIVPSPPAR
ncbi:MAG: cytochrome b N-terminal domain-containing protein [Terracidiphilus sp.]